MRNLFLMLVLANLAFAAWHFWFAETNVPVSRAVSDAPTITLIDELDEATGDDAIAETCISIGTFAERSQADAAVASLRALGLDAAVAEPAELAELELPAEPADADVASVEAAERADPVNAETNADGAIPADSAEPDAPFWIDIVMDLSEMPEAGLPQPLGPGLVSPPGEDTADTPPPVMSLTLRACDTATE